MREQDKVDACGSACAEQSQPMRILHIGNIANNAYLNAKLLQTGDVVNDVLSYSNYHIMTCFQWEEDLSLLNYAVTPEKLRLHARESRRQKPSWFRQGPLGAALYCLKEDKKTIFSRLLLKETAFRTKIASNEPFLESGTAKKFYQFMARRFSLLEKLALIQFVNTENRIELYKGLLQRGLKREHLPERLRAILGYIYRQYLHWPLRCLAAFIIPFSPPPPSRPWRQQEIIKLCESAEDAVDSRYYWQVEPPYWLRCLMSRVLDNYDVIIGYSTDGQWPWLVNKHPYCAFEHGTIRSIPFENTFQGKLCKVTYQEADHVFITNCDNITAAKTLELKNYCFVPHPINEDIPDWIEAHKLRLRLNSLYPADFWIFHPSRQHWEERRHPSWEKGNDFLIRGMAEAVSQGLNVGAVFVDWGLFVKESKALIDELGLTDRVVWIDPVPHPLMVEYILATDCVADQFWLGAFGSTSPKALMLGRAALIHLDEERHRWCLPELPPMINVQKAGEIAAALLRLHKDGAYRTEIESAGKEWYRKYHSNQAIRDIMLPVLNALAQKKRATAAK
ncbi:hypothetical protein LJC15_00320 [Desulfovibrio sp. OttesenSCG-928-G11]|nr:hypothetical protein [Desulfovibrio sp. OttesenSCG-928-G11]